MVIRMLSDQVGAIDGIHTASYREGVLYDLSDSKGARELATAFVGARMAVEVADAAEGKAVVSALIRQVESAPVVEAQAIPGVEVEQIAPGEQIDGQGLEPVVEAPKPSGKRQYNRKN